MYYTNELLETFKSSYYKKTETLDIYISILEELKTFELDKLRSNEMKEIFEIDECIYEEDEGYYLSRYSEFVALNKSDFSVEHKVTTPDGISCYEIYMLGDFLCSVIKFTNNDKIFYSDELYELYQYAPYKTFGFENNTITYNLLSTSLEVCEDDVYYDIDLDDWSYYYSGFSDKINMLIDYVSEQGFANECIRTDYRYKEIGPLYLLILDDNLLEVYTKKTSENYYEDFENIISFLKDNNITDIENSDSFINIDGKLYLGTLEDNNIVKYTVISFNEDNIKAEETLISDDSLPELFKDILIFERNKNKTSSLFDD